MLAGILLQQFTDVSCYDGLWGKVFLGMQELLAIKTRGHVTDPKASGVQLYSYINDHHLCDKAAEMNTQFGVFCPVDLLLLFTLCESLCPMSCVQ